MEFLSYLFISVPAYFPNKDKRSKDTVEQKLQNILIQKY